MSLSKQSLVYTASLHFSNKILSWMIEIWMKDHLLNDNICNIITHYDASYQSAFFDKLSFFWIKFGKPLIELYALELIIIFEQQLAHLASSWLINQATSLSRHLAKQGHLAQIEIHVEGAMGSIPLGNP